MPVRRGLVAALAALAVATPLALAASRDAAASPASRAPTLVVSIPGPFAGCDPGSTSMTPATAAVLSLVLPSAFTPGLTDSPDGDTSVIAQAEVVSESPQVVDYTIAPGAAWPDGDRLTAADLIRTWHERRADRVVADLGYRGIVSMRTLATSPGVAATFTKPYADWESLFALVVPAATASAACTLPSATLDPSIGPYELVSATHTQVELAANPHWLGTAPAYAHVVVTSDPTTPPQPSAKSARAVYLPSPTLAQLEALTSTGVYDGRVQHDTTVVSLDFAVRGPGALPGTARAGLAHLIDRAALVASLAAPIDDTAAPAVSHLFGQAQMQYAGPTGGSVSSPAPVTMPVPGARGATAYGDLADRSAADESLTDAGYRLVGTTWTTASGSPLAICMTVPADSATLGPVATELASQLRANGVAVTVDPAASSTAVYQALRDGSCTSAVVSRTADEFVSHSAANWIEPVAPEVHGLSWTGVDDPLVAAHAAAAGQVLNPVVAASTWDAMDNRLWVLMAGLPLYSPSAYVGWSPSIAGILPCDSVAGFVAQVPALVPTTEKQ